MSFISIALAWSKRIVALLVFLVVYTAGGAQIEQSAKFEIPLIGAGESKFSTAGLGEKGLMLYRLLAGRKTDYVELIKVDTALLEKWKGRIECNKGYTIARSRHYKESFFILLRNQIPTRSDFKIISLQLANGSYIQYDIKNLISFNPVELIINDQAALIAGYFGDRPVILYFSFNLQRTKVLPGFFNDPGELNQLKTNEDGSIDVVTRARNIEKKRTIWVRNYNASGDLLRTTQFQPEAEKNLLSGKSVQLGSGEQIVAGVYGKLPDYAQGVFIARILTDGTYTINYHNFTDFQHSFNYMKVRKRERVITRVERKKLKGRKMKFNHRYLLHDLIPYQENYILTGEAFYPNYIFPGGGYLYYRQSAPTGYYFPSRLRNDLIFDGYQYTHAIVMGFDSKGIVHWDNSFAINDSKIMQLEQLVKVKPQPNRIEFLYRHKKTIRAKIMSNDEILEVEIPDSQYDDNSRGNRNIESLQLEHWYGDYFYTAGVQKLWYQSGTEPSVFFVRKITCK